MHSTVDAELLAAKRADDDKLISHAERRICWGLGVGYEIKIMHTDDTEVPESVWLNYSIAPAPVPSASASARRKYVRHKLRLRCAIE